MTRAIHTHTLNVIDLGWRDPMFRIILTPSIGIFLFRWRDIIVYKGCSYVINALLLRSDRTPVFETFGIQRKRVYFTSGARHNNVWSLKRKRRLGRWKLIGKTCVVRSLSRRETRSTNSVRRFRPSLFTHAFGCWRSWLALVWTVVRTKFGATGRLPGRLRTV